MMIAIIGRHRTITAILGLHESDIRRSVSLLQIDLH